MFRVDRRELVEVAIALADTEGVGAVTLRSAAQRAGLTPAELRREFGSRDRLLAAAVQQLFAQRRSARTDPARTDSRRSDLTRTDRTGTGSARSGSARSGSAGSDPAGPSTPPFDRARPDPAANSERTPEETPIQTLTRLAAEEWAIYREHPWLVTVLASSRPPLVPAVLDAARASTEAFVALGLDPPSALGRYVALSGYVQGMALLLLAEQGEAAHSGTAYRTWWSEELRRLDRTGAWRRHPWLDAATGGTVPASFVDEADAWFRAGLDRVLAGLVADDGQGPPRGRTP